ncbi:DUF6390 family protein [Georgenia ruanii]|uniref:Uncharacterized protein n=1 Tax=Georgenia ruanii TaxID=348442 RepID=A0A7J9UTU5_9MICO|nr:DUF6390 family protein [Georgenia ruanii]MPV87174.1 hypothetical protein [Georgenia ruanii]
MTATTTRTAVPGPVLFARYAFPPNRHGYCGPADHLAFFESGTAGDDRGLRAMAREFAGAWPYLELIAGATGLPDPLDHRAVEAYWVGSRLLDRVGVTHVAGSMEERFRYRAGPRFGRLTAEVLAGGVPHHSFAVFCVYPWTGLLGDDRRAAQALTVLDMCRIRWGRVVHVHGDRVEVASRHLGWDGRRLDLGSPRPETVERAVDGLGPGAELRPGDWVAMHWEWVCDRLTDAQVRALSHYTARHLRILNDAADAGPLGLLA